MIILFSDFGWSDPYVGQVKGRLAVLAPGIPVIDLLHAVPAYNAHAGAHLLAALAPEFPVGSVFLCVVDPGVGSLRGTLVAEADGRWYVGPDNGLISVVAGRARMARYWRIDWRPERLSDSFHGRDLFAPIAAELARHAGECLGLAEIAAPEVRFDLAELPRLIFLDHYGNAWTGMRAGLVPEDAVLVVKGRHLLHRRVFAEAERDEPFWYVNSVGLVEIAVNRGNAGRQLGLEVGDRVTLVGSGGAVQA